MIQNNQVSRLFEKIFHYLHATEEHKWRFYQFSAKITIFEEIINFEIKIQNLIVMWRVW